MSSFPITTVADYLDDWRRRRRRLRAGAPPDPPPAAPPRPYRPRPNRRRGGSQYRGVSLYKPTGRWTASFRYYSRLYTCGAFDTEVEAARAHDAKAREVIGEKALLNFPEEAQS